VYYEVTFRRASDYVSKFDRIIAFTRLDISKNYAVKLSVSNDKIDILGKSMPMQIIDNWDVSIRPCELDNFAKIFGNPSKVSNSKEAFELMKYLTNSGLNLVEIIDLSDWYYNYTRTTITKKAQASHIFKILDKCRKISQKKVGGSNVIRYLLYRLNNRIIKKQFNNISCGLLSDLYLNVKCIPFDKLPFNTSLVNHNPKVTDLFNLIDTQDRQHEIFARLIKNNTIQRGKLYTPIREILNFENIDALIQDWNDSLYYLT